MQYFKIIDKPEYRTSELLQQCKDKFPVWSWYSNEELDTQFPAPKKVTTRYFKKEIEADENLKNMSANDLKEKGVKGITLRERIIIELEYFNETGKHLDIDNWTLCSGSRNSDGGVPRAYWHDGELLVDYYSPGFRLPGLRSREAVSLPTSSPLSLEQAIELIKKEGYVIYKQL